MPFLYPPALALADRVGGARGIWGEHPEYPVRDWQWEVGEDYTRLGYWEWVLAHLNPDPSDPEHPCESCGGAMDLVTPGDDTGTPTWTCPDCGRAEPEEEA